MSDSSPVLVVGSGPAGMAAAMALARAGLQVRIIERADLVGGKVNSHHEGGQSLEHGVHGWWMNYINFDRLLRWSDVKPEDALQEAEGSEIVLPDARRYRLRLLSSNLPSPLFFLAQIAKAPYFSFFDLIRVLPFSIHALAFRHEFDYNRYDSFTFQQLMDYVGVSPRMQKLLFEMFILSFDFTTPDRVSAGCGLSGLQFYALRDQQSILPRWSRQLPADAIFGPMLAQLERQGTRISLATSVENIVIQNGEVTGVSLVESKPEAPQTAVPVEGTSTPPTPAAAALDATQTAVPDVVQGQVALAAIPQDNLIKVSLSAGSAWVGYQDGSLEALNARCTHEGCTVDWNADQGAFVCPCHGGRFARNGNVLQGPPQNPLQKLTCRVDGTNVEILGNAGPPPQACADLILAVDLGSAQQLVAQTDNLPTDLRHNIGHLDTTPVIVVRIWFRTPKTEPLESAFTPGFPFVDNFFYVNSFDRDIRAEGHVAEVQAYHAAAQYLDANDETILNIALADLLIINSAYIRQNVVHFTVNRHAALFTHYGPGQNGFRPTEASGVEGLYLAGDWTQAPWSVWMMERGVVSGLRAANAVLRRRGFPEIEILRLSKEHVLLRAARSLALLVRLFVLRGLPRGDAPSDDEMASHNEGDYRFVGWMMFYVAVCNFLPLFSGQFAALRKLWQVPFLLLTLASLSHTEPDVQFQYGNWLRAWRDRSTLQHRLMTLLAIAGLVCEMQVAFRGADSAWALALFPIGMVATTITFLGHHHRPAVVIARQHQIIMVVVISTGLLWLGSRILVSLAPLALAWPLTYGFAAHLFITYTEHELVQSAHDDGGEGDHHHVD